MIIIIIIINKQHPPIVIMQRNISKTKTSQLFVFAHVRMCVRVRVCMFAIVIVHVPLFVCVHNIMRVCTYM